MKVNDWSRLEKRVMEEDPWMASRNDLHILAKALNLCVKRIGNSAQKENDKLDAITLSTHMSDLIGWLELKVTNLTKARAIDAGLMDGMRLVIKQLEKERDCAKAAMAKEMESLCSKGILDCLAVMDENPHANLARIAARHSAFLEMKAAILALAEAPAGYMCVKVEEPKAMPKIKISGPAVDELRNRKENG